MLKSRALTILLLISALGLLGFLLVSSTFSFQSSLFKALYPKPPSFAQLAGTPSVDLKVTYKDESFDDVINVSAQDLPLSITWTTTGGPTACKGFSWGVGDQDKNWDGDKNILGGTFFVEGLPKNTAYVYTINCANQNGDAAGDSVTINLGASSATLPPNLTSITAFQNGERLDLEKPLSVKVGDKIKIEWDSLNTQTPYSTCVASGSWPIIYENVSFATEEFVIVDRKIHQFSIYCSNEQSNFKKSLTFLVE